VVKTFQSFFSHYWVWGVQFIHPWFLHRSKASWFPFKVHQGHRSKWLGIKKVVRIKLWCPGFHNGLVLRT